MGRQVQVRKRTFAINLAAAFDMEGVRAVAIGQPQVIVLSSSPA
jgi:hypothetical protein